MNRLSRLHVPMRGPCDVIPFLGDPGHYKEGRSAQLIAESWFAANGLPIMIAHCLGQVGRFAGAELVDGFVERSTDLGDGRRPSQSDLLAIVGLRDEIAIVAVEGKVDEGFGQLVSEWLVDASPQKQSRLGKLTATLGLELSAALPLRYQLLHRTASAIYEARRYRAKAAVTMVHSFDPNDAGIVDFKRFACALGLHQAEATRLVGPIQREGVDLYLGWAADRLSNEGFSIVDGRKSDVGLYD